MKAVWKFPLAVETHQSVRMPQGAELLSLQVQHEVPCIWALVDEDADLVVRDFLTFGTGHTNIHPRTPGSDFVGTYQISGGDLVFHVFEASEEESESE